MTEYGQVDFNIPELETELIFDTERDHYQVVHVGFSNKRRVYGCVLHVDIKNGKIWIQHDGTEGGIADELVDGRALPGLVAAQPEVGRPMGSTIAFHLQRPNLAIAFINLGLLSGSG